MSEEMIAFLEDTNPAHWWNNLTPEQNQRLGDLIDSRVRLLGETYSRAHINCTVNITEENKAFVLDGPRR